VGMIGFHLLFPDEAANECRTVIPVGRTDLPRRTFVLTEAYCADPQCDCRRVMLNVIDAETHSHHQLRLRAAEAAVRGRRTDFPRSAQSTDGDVVSVSRVDGRADGARPRLSRPAGAPLHDVEARRR
jgi:hypothetical protein